jgi:hypothetical protein
MATATGRSRHSHRSCDGDPRLLTQWCSGVLRDTRAAQAAADANGDAAEQVRRVAPRVIGCARRGALVDAASLEAARSSSRHGSGAHPSHPRELSAKPAPSALSHETLLVVVTDGKLIPSIHRCCDRYGGAHVAAGDGREHQ